MNQFRLLVIVTVTYREAMSTTSEVIECESVKHREETSLQLLSRTEPGRIHLACINLPSSLGIKSDKDRF